VVPRRLDHIEAATQPVQYEEEPVQELHQEAQYVPALYDAVAAQLAHQLEPAV